MINCAKLKDLRATEVNYKVHFLYFVNIYFIQRFYSPHELRESGMKFNSSELVTVHVIPETHTQLALADADHGSG